MTRITKFSWEIASPLMGGLMTLAFAPYDYVYAVVPGLMYLYHSWSRLPPKRAIFNAYLFGLGLFACGIGWVYISIHDFGRADSVSAVALTGLLVSVWACFPAMTAWLAVKIVASPRVWFRVVATAWLWVIVEFIRGNWLLNGFPWLQIAYSQLHTPLGGFAPVLGVYGVGFLLSAMAFAFVEALNRHLSARDCLMFMLVICGAGEGLTAIAWTRPIGEPIKITLVQGNIDQAQKWQVGQRQTTLNLYRQLTEQHWDSNVIIWPETAIPAFLSQVKSTFLEPLGTSAQQHNVDLVLSLPTEGQGDSYFNSVLTIGRDQALYHKHHLLPFGEYLPLQPFSGWLLDLMEIPLGKFTAGDDRQALLKAGGFPFVTTICYEDVFGELVARQIADAAYIVNVTNDAWFGDSAQPHQHMQMAQMRALETGRYLVRVANTGLTGFVRPDGRISKQAPQFATSTLTDVIVPMGGITPYIMVGDHGVLALLFGLSMVLYGMGSRAANGKRLVFQE